MRATVFILPDGTVRGVYSDILQGAQLGEIQVERLSNVEFNRHTQEWEARTLNGTILANETSREACIQEEVSILTEQLAKEVESC